MSVLEAFLEMSYGLSSYGIFQQRLMQRVCFTAMDYKITMSMEMSRPPKAMFRNFEIAEKCMRLEGVHILIPLSHALTADQLFQPYGKFTLFDSSVVIRIGLRVSS